MEKQTICHVKKRSECLLGAPGIQNWERSPTFMRVAEAYGLYFQGMPIPFKCPACAIEGNANDWFAGRRARCSCGNILDFKNAAPQSDLPVGKTEEGKVVDKRTGLDRRTEKRDVPTDRRSGTDRRDRED